MRAVSVHCLGMEVRVHVKVKVKAKTLSIFSIRHHMMCDEWKFRSTNS